MQRKKLTKSVVESIPVPEKGEIIVWDTEIRGFHVRVRPSGRRTYAFFYRTLQGVQRKPRIGEHGPSMPCDAARARAVAMHADVMDGLDPSEDRRSARNDLSLDAYWRKYVEAMTPRWKPNTPAGYQCRWNAHIRPALGHCALKGLTRQQVKAFHDRMGSVSKSQANRCVSLLHAMYEYAADAGDFEGENPAGRIKRYPERGRETYLNVDQLRILFAVIAREEAAGIAAAVSWPKRTKTKGKGTKGQKEIASRGISRHAASLFRLLTYTGARLREISMAHWSYVDWEACALRLPDSKTGQKVIWLNSEAMAELRGLREIRTQGTWIIEGGKPGSYLVSAMMPWRRIRRMAAEQADAEEAMRRKKAGLKAIESGTTAGAVFRQLRMHDLRHTLVSTAIDGGVPLAIAGKMVGHRSMRSTERYAHIADAATQRASQFVGSSIAAATVASDTANVIHLDPKKKASAV